MKSRKQLEDDIQYWETLVAQLKATKRPYIKQEDILNQMKWELAEMSDKKSWWKIFSMFEK